MSEHAADSTTRRQDQNRRFWPVLSSSSSMGTGSFVVATMAAVRLDDEDPTTTANDDEEVVVLWFQPNFHSKWVEQPLVRWRNSGLMIDTDTDTNRYYLPQTVGVRRIQEENDITPASIPTTTQRMVPSSSRPRRVDKGSSSHPRRRPLPPPRNKHNNKLPIPPPPNQLQIPTPPSDYPLQTKTTTTMRLQQRPTYNSHSSYFHHYHHQYPSVRTVLPRRTRLLTIRSTLLEGPEEKEAFTTTATTTLHQQQQQQEEEEFYDLGMASIGGSSEESSFSFSSAQSPDPPQEPTRSSSSSFLRAPMAPGEDAHSSNIHRVVEDDEFTRTYHHGDNEEVDRGLVLVPEPPYYKHMHPTTIVVSPDHDDQKINKTLSTTSSTGATLIKTEPIEEWKATQDLVEDATDDDSMNEVECDYFVLPRSKRNLLEHSSSPSPSSSSSSTLLKGDLFLSSPKMERILEEQVEVEPDKEEAEAEEALSSSSSSRTSVIQPTILFPQDEGLPLSSSSSPSPVHSSVVVVVTPSPQGHVAISSDAVSTIERSHRMGKDNSPDYSTSSSHPSATSTTDGSHWDLTTDASSPQVEQDGDREVVWV